MVPLLVPPKMSVYNFNFSIDSTVHFRPELDCNFGWGCTHLYCGAFGGWNQAVEWIPNAGVGFSPGRHIFVDNCEVITDLRSVKHDVQVLKCRLKQHEGPGTLLQNWECSGMSLIVHCHSRAAVN